MLRDALVVTPPDALESRHVTEAIASMDWRAPACPARSRARNRSRRSPFAVRAVVVAIVAGLTMTLGLAEAGALPGPVQRIVVDVGRFAGVHLPAENSQAAAPTFRRF